MNEWMFVLYRGVRSELFPRTPSRSVAVDKSSRSSRHSPGPLIRRANSYDTIANTYLKCEWPRLTSEKATQVGGATYNALHRQLFAKFCFPYLQAKITFYCIIFNFLNCLFVTRDSIVMSSGWEVVSGV